jgi:hypothetical protein
MSGAPLRANPTAVLLLDLAGRRATGRIAFGDRTLVISEGELIDITAAAYEVVGDAPREELFVERLTDALRTSEARGEPVPVLEPALRSRAPDGGLPFGPLLLDALARNATESDLAWLSTQLDHRVGWRSAPATAIAQKWASLPPPPERPAVSTVLARRPTAAPRLAALLRTGLAHLEPPGRSNSPRPVGTGTLPPPAPRLSILPVVAAVTPLPDLLSQLSAHPPRVRLDPGQAHDAGEPLTATELPVMRAEPAPIDDPIEALEQRIASLEAAGAKGPERARAFVALADSWLQRLGSVERACRALREACAADPSDGRVLQQTALYCQLLGDAELALRYADAAVLASSISVERASIQRLRAAILRSQGQRDALIEALCEAASDDPASPEPHEEVAALLEADNPQGANAHARLAAAGYQDSEPARAIAWLDWALALLPGDVPTVYEHASLLDAHGSRNAAVAVLARAADVQTDPDARRKLRLSAAQRAEAAGRADRAAELLEDALDAEPHFDLLYAPLDEDLIAAGFPEHRAVVLEDIATACPDNQRPLWLTRAARALIALDGQSESALWIAFEAALMDGDRSEPLELLRKHATQPIERVLLAYALRAASASALAKGGDAKPLLEELAHVGIETLDNPELGLAALEQLARLQPLRAELDALHARAMARAREREEQLGAAEQALAGLAPGAPERGALCTRLAALLPDLPEAWPRKIELLHAALASGASRKATTDTLLGLYGLTRDAAGLAAFLEDQIDAAEDKQERARLLLRLAAVHTVREDAHAVAATCEQILALDPGHRMAIARLQRAARRLGVPALWVRALQHRARIATTSAARARALARLSRACELAGMGAEACAHAVAALELDTGATDAALVLLATYRERSASSVLSALQKVPQALCASARAYAAIAHCAAACNDGPALAHALERWTQLVPTDARAHELRLTGWPLGASGPALHEAAQAALSACGTSAVLNAVRGAIDRLEKTHEGLAARLCLRLAEEQGRDDAALLQRAARLAGRIAPELRTRALELWAAAEPEARRAPVLLELALHHAKQSDALGELRALLRVLELDVAPAGALERLSALFIAAGDVTRALSVATLRLEAQDEGEQRREALIGLATLAGRHGGDLERAELYVRRLVAESEGEPSRVRDALGVLLALGEPGWALARARAIADGCPEEVRGRIYHACAATAESTLRDPRMALELSAHGATLSPSHAPLLLMMERLSLSLGDAHTALTTYDALIASAIGPHGRRALVYRSGRWLERAGDLGAALERYLEAFRLEPSAGAAFMALARVADQTGQIERTVPCLERLAEVVTHDLTRADLLKRAARICGEELDDPARAFSILRKANMSREHAELAQLAELAAKRLSARDADAGRRAFAQLAEDIEQRAEQLWEGPDKVRCLLRLAAIGVVELGEGDKALARADEALALVEREQLGTELLAEALSERERLAALLGPEEVPTAPPPPTTTRSSLPAVDRAGAREQLFVTVAREPFRADAIRKLYAFAKSEPSSVDAHVATALLSAFDRSVTPPADPGLHSGAWKPEALRAALADDLPDDARRLLTRLWEAARTLPRFRQSAASLGANDRERIARLSSSALAEAYAQAARLLNASEVPVYGTHLPAGVLARVLPTHPPAVLMSRAPELTRTQLLWALGRALTLALPEHVIGGVLPAADAKVLLEASMLAFGTRQGRTPSVATSTGAKEIAAALWQNVPARDQRDLSGALDRYRELFVYEALHARVHALAARAGLLCAGDIRTSLLAVIAVDPALEHSVVRDDASFAQACRDSVAFAATVSCATRAELRQALARVLRPTPTPTY